MAVPIDLLNNPEPSSDEVKALFLKELEICRKKYELISSVIYTMLSRKWFEGNYVIPFRFVSKNPFEHFFYVIIVGFLVVECFFFAKL